MFFINLYLKPGMILKRTAVRYFKVYEFDGTNTRTICRIKSGKQFLENERRLQ